ncbi:Mur ligase family protein [Staphylococcus agnetis]|uniref:Mur ligase family protein n=1 Tax=Staphylococcus agnetis TaxID=985762 RepID=UPI00208E8D60|nr:UDP-N-acetylmuramoyl-tripeptide--D-alanyl-D-alanine ligase [Staphylococcus agnetis]MCO4365773.1 UDP-N-acetylmuramoyl-tripeptide--D-alanyl-D-alanine ligase [Staphylococcus agnetis]
MATIQNISKVLEPLIIKENLTSNNDIKDFEIYLSNINNNSTALFNISEESWLRYFNFKKKKKSNFEILKKNHRKVSLIITDENLPSCNNSDFILVQNTFEAMKLLAIHFRHNYKKPLIAITGSFGKTSTRMMLEKVLEDFNVLHSAGNANMRIPVLLNLCKLIQNPDYALFEVSLNALNNKGNMSKIIKPDIAIVTGIGEAHLSTISGTKEIAKFKGRLFEGLSSSGVAIINGDTPHAIRLKEKALKYTENIRFYNFKENSNDADFTVYSVKYLKGQTRISINIKDHCITYILNCLGEGMVINSLAVVQVILEMRLNIEDSLNKLSSFKPLSKVLEVKNIEFQNNVFTLIDDTHNASLPAMINAIKTFDDQSHFYKGTKIIALGKISDLGETSHMIHQQLVPLLTNSSADFILCADKELKPVVNKVKRKNITWYKDIQVLLNDLCSILTPNSITLMKSSITGTHFPEVAKKLPCMIEQGYIKECSIFYDKKPSPSITFIPKNEYFENVIFSNCEAIEGLAPLFYYVTAKIRKLSNKSVKIKKWPTNDSVYYEGKKLMLHELIENMITRPHPSLVYQLADELFDSEQKRKEEVDNFIKKCKLSPSSIINVTGRYMIKERHQFKHIDLYKIFDQFGDILFNDYHTIYFGYKTLNGIMKNSKGIIIFTSYRSELDLTYDILERNF